MKKKELAICLLNGVTAGWLLVLQCGEIIAKRALRPFKPPQQRP